MSYRRHISFLGLLLLLLALMSSLTASYAAEDSPISAEATTASCRYGVGATNKPSDPTGHTVPYVESVNAGWFLDFTTGPQTGYPTMNADFIRVVRIQQDKDPNDASKYLNTYRYKWGTTAASITAAAKATPGQLWFVGNEPDRIQVQDDIMPKMYAKIYHDTYALIKAADPTAQVGIAGLVQVTPARLQYLDIVWNEYKTLYGTEIPVDVWNIHTYPLAEWTPSDPDDPYNPTKGTYGPAAVALGTDLSLALLSTDDPAKCGIMTDKYMCDKDHADPNTIKHQVESMRQWMANKNLQSKPLVISELGILWYYQQQADGSCTQKDEDGKCYDRARTLAFMKEMNTYLETKTDAAIGNPNDNNKLVQQWLWFSMYEGPYNSTYLSNSSNLLENQFWTKTPGAAASYSPIGVEFKNAAATSATSLNLAVTDVSYTRAAGSKNVQLKATIYNNGNAAISNPVTVTFYSDSAMTKEIGKTTMTAPLAGCARNSYQASINWTVPATSLTAAVWVKVSSAATETVQTDNVKSISVSTADHQILLPIIVR